MSKSKVCPYCAETIKADAIICRFCGRDLPSPATPVSNLSADDKSPGRKKKLRNFLLVMVGVPLLCFCSVMIFAIRDINSPEYQATETAAARGENSAAASPQTPIATNAPEPTSTPEPTNTPEPVLELEVSNVAHYPSSGSSIVFYGEVENVGDLPAAEPEVSIVLYDENDGILVTDSTILDLPLALSLWFSGVLYPGEKAPFVILIDDPGNWVDYKIDLAYEQARPSQYEEHYDAFEITNDTGRAIDDLLYNYRVSGEIENIGELPTGPVRFAVTFYDAEGKVVGSVNHMLDVDPFAPGDKQPFTIDDYVYGEVASYAFLTRAIKK